MFKKILCIFWKDLLLRRNHYFATSFEVVLPVLLIILANISLPKFEGEIDNDPISFETYKEGQCVPRHTIYGNILYEPSTPFTDALMSKAACYAGYKMSSVKAGNLCNETSYFSIGVKFNNLLENNIEIPNNLNYTLFPTNKVWTGMLRLWKYSELTVPRYSIPSIYSVVEFQRAIDTSYLYLKNIPAKKINLENMNLFDKGPRVFSLAIYFTLFVAFSLMVPPIVSRIVQEKSTGAKELMLMMGIVRWHLWVAKFADVVLFLTISMSGVVLFSYIPFKADANVLQISPVIMWCVLMYGFIGVIFFLFFMSCFFEKATIAVYVTQIVWSVTFALSRFISAMADLPAFVNYVLCLFPHIALMNGVSLLLNFDFYGKTISLTEKLSGKDDSLSLLSVLCIMTFNIILYILLTWYLEQVKPGRYGVPQPYNFCFKKSYWLPRKVLNSYNNSCSNNNCGNFESVPKNLRVGVSVQNISKVYQTLDKGIITAVDCVSLDFYHGEISALLGHNGAGKTTVFSMITGMSYPTSGKVIINGYDLGLNICEARRNLGLCPQQDMLFNDLTTTQILNFYGVIKGLEWKKAKSETWDLIKKLKLGDVKNTEASKLSGGQKRKVSLAIALIGGSEVLVLDEPTSGMDPEIRREIWELLLGFRGTRTILLTTHFMEEADALCDRIAIMDHGIIKCYGTPMFLKAKYGKGYVLSVVVLDLDTTKDLVDYIKGFIPEAKFKSQNIRTLSFELPESEVDVFPALLSGLEEKQTKNEIASYCISLATLEDVFLRLRTNHEATDDFDAIDSPYKKLDITEDSGPRKVSKFALFMYQLWYLLVKKWIFFRRHLKAYIMYCITSAALVGLVISLSRNKTPAATNIDLNSSKPLPYSLEVYPTSTVLFSNLQDENEKQLFTDLVNSLGSHTQGVSDIKAVVNKTFKEDFYTYIRKLNLGVEFSSEETKIFHNEEAIHMVPVSLNLIHNFLLKLRFKNSSITTSMSIRFANKELYVAPRTAPKCNIKDLPDFSGTQSFFYVLGPIKERFYGAKGIQLMIASASIYWLSHLLFDAASFLAYIVFVFLGVGLSQSDEFMQQHADEVLFGLFLWGCGLILLTYVISTFIKDAAAAFSVNIIIYIVFTFIIYNVISLEGLPRHFQYLHPTCILKLGYNDLCSDVKSNYIWGLLVYDLVLFAYLYLKDSKILGEIFHRIANRLVKVDYSLEDDKDEYVKEEEATVGRLIHKKNVSPPTLLVDEVKRWYLKGFRPSAAVRGVSFAVNRGECFGLLGVNGAGKTSTFKMLTGSLSLSHGRAFACKEKLSLVNRRKYLLSIGYCPQTGGLIPNFTGKELLELFARLRGIHRSDVREEVHKWLEKMNLLEYSNQKCGTYSGGNQRKLSTAVALIGDCPLVFLDEPTSGVDPLSRRAIWNVIGSIQKEGQSVVLTSHSMDECEALCSRLAIMVNGRFRCIGETTTLKDRFGQGYCVQLKLSNGASEDVVQSLKNAVLTAFEFGCELVDEHLTVLQYHVKNKSIGWADLFSKLNTLKKNFCILESYTASATTLEQIFIYFARNQ